jgi:hypothetical protein
MAFFFAREGVRNEIVDKRSLIVKEVRRSKLEVLMEQFSKLGLKDRLDDCDIDMLINLCLELMHWCNRKLEEQ